MIKLEAPIEDPAAFLGELEPLEGLQSSRYASEIFAAPDFDVYVDMEASDEPESDKLEEHCVIPILGNLLLTGSLTNTQAGIKRYANWHKSPDVVNALLTQLGLTPGEDVCKFVHSPHGLIPPHDYAAHVSRREHPMSTSAPGHYFMHDRDTTHVAGVIFMPPKELSHYVKFGTKQIMHANSDNSAQAAVINLARSHDHLTTFVSEVVKHAGPDVEQDKEYGTWKESILQSTALRPVLYNLGTVSPIIWPIPRSDGFEAAGLYRAKQIYERMQELMPRIRLLRNQIEKPIL